MARLCLRPLGEDLSLALPASGSPRHFLACGHATPISASVFTWQSFYVCLSSHGILFLLGHQTYWIRATLMTSSQLDNICNALFSKSQVLGVQHIFCWGHNSSLLSKHFFFFFALFFLTQLRWVTISKGTSVKFKWGKSSIIYKEIFSVKSSKEFFLSR